VEEGANRSGGQTSSQVGFNFGHPCSDHQNGGQIETQDTLPKSEASLNRGLACGLPISLSIILTAFTNFEVITLDPVHPFGKWVALGVPQFEGLATTESNQGKSDPDQSTTYGAQRDDQDHKAYKPRANPATASRWLNTHTPPTREREDAYTVYPTRRPPTRVRCCCGHLTRGRYSPADAPATDSKISLSLSQFFLCLSLSCSLYLSLSFSLSSSFSFSSS